MYLWGGVDASGMDTRICGRSMVWMCGGIYMLVVWMCGGTDIESVWIYVDVSGMDLK